MASEDRTTTLKGTIFQTVRLTAFAVNTLVGDQLGLYKAMDRAGPMTSMQLAQKTTLDERYLRDWLINQAANGVLDYNPTTQTFTLPEEHAVVVAREDTPHFCLGPVQNSIGSASNVDRIIDNFRHGGGMPWGEQGHHVAEGTRRFFRPMYDHLLVQHWIPNLDQSIQNKLKTGARVADVGCGHGWSTMVMAKAFPNSKFFGFDYDPQSVTKARELTKGLTNVRFETTDARQIADKEGKFDLVMFFDCFHDMHDPGTVTKHTRQMVKDDGAVLLVEPLNCEKVEDYFNLPGQIFSGYATMCCLQCAKVRGKDCICLGPIAPPSMTEKLWREGGFTKVRGVTVPHTPMNRVWEIMI